MSEKFHHQHSLYHGSLVIVTLLVVFSARWSRCLSTTGNGKGIACSEVISPYLDAAFKCLPEDFLEKSVCVGERLKMSCLRGKYLAIHSAVVFPSGEAECAVPSRVLHFSPSDCSPVCVRPLFAHSCQGKRRCSVETPPVLSAHFSKSECLSNGVNPQQASIQVVYTCVAKYLLKFIANGSLHSSAPDPCPPEAKLELVTKATASQLKSSSRARPNNSSSSSSFPVAMATAAEAASSTEFSAEIDHRPSFSSGGRSVSSSASGSVSPDAFPVKQNGKIESLTEELPRDTEDELFATVAMETVDDITSGIVTSVHPKWFDVWWYYLSSEWTWSYKYITENQEKFFLYVALGISLGFIFVLFAIVLRLSLTKSVLAPISNPQPNHHHNHHHHHQRPLSKTDPGSSSAVLQPLTMSCTSPITWRLPDIDPSIAGDEPPGRGCEIKLTSFNRLNSLPRPRRESILEIPPPPSPASSMDDARKVDFEVAGTIMPTADVMTSTTATISRSHLNFIDSHSFGMQQHQQQQQPRFDGSISTPIPIVSDPSVESKRMTGIGNCAEGFPLGSNNHLFHVRHQYSLSAVSVRPVTTKFGSFGRTMGAPCGQEFRELSDLAQLSKTLELPIGNRYFCT